MRCMLAILVLSFAVIVGPGLSAVLAQDESAPSQEGTITMSKSEWEAFKARLDALEKEVQALKGQQGQAQQPPAPTPPASEAEVTPPSETPAAQSPAGGGKFFSLPDISLVAQAVGKASSDSRDPDRNRVLMKEVELGVQGYVYPDVKADAFITMSPSDNAAAQVEEAYLTYLGLRKGLNLYVGEKHVAFGRTNLLHDHSWLYVRPPLALRNLVASESLVGQGAEASYVLPTKGDLFAQLNLGTWTGLGPEQTAQLPNIEVGPGAAFPDRFNTARLWASHPIGENNELELGGSYAGGPAAGYAIPGDARATLTGLDLSFRHFGEGTSRLLLRGETLWRHEENATGGATAGGYYLFGNWRQNKYFSTGLLWDWSEFPQAPDLHESALSLILTQQLSEQYYLRLQGTHGSRPGDASYNELWLQWVWGVGPHTHNLE